MRVAVGIHGSDIDRVIETYNLMSERYFTHASPTLFNAGTPNPQLSSCFLVCMKDDSIEGIYDTLKSCAMISKTAGGIGLNIHCIRATGWVKFCHLSSIVLIMHLDPTLPVPMDIPMVLYPCCEHTTQLRGTLTKEGTSALEHSPSTLSHGMPISSNSSTSVRITERNKLVHAICSMRSGFRISCE